MILSGCGVGRYAYDGPPLPSDEVAVIKLGWVAFYGFGAVVNDIKLVDSSPIRKMDPLANEMTDLEVLPGKHRIFAIRYHKSCGSVDLPLPGGDYPLWSSCSKYLVKSGWVNFTAQAGSVYDLESDVVEGQVYFWIVDEETGKVVSEEKPPALPRLEGECWDAGAAEYVPCGKRVTY